MNPVERWKIRNNFTYTNKSGERGSCFAEGCGETIREAFAALKNDMNVDREDYPEVKWEDFFVCDDFLGTCWKPPYEFLISFNQGKTNKNLTEQLHANPEWYFMGNKPPMTSSPQKGDTNDSH